MKSIERLAAQLESTASNLERESDLESGDLRAFEVLERAAPPRRRPTLWILAAALLLLAALWGVVSMVGRDDSGGLDEAALLAEARLSPYPEQTRSAPTQHEFRSGERVYLHFVLERPAGIFVALLDSRLLLSSVSQAVSALPAGNQRSLFELDDESGTETLLLIAGDEDWTTEQARQLIRVAAEAGPWDDRTSAVDSIIAACDAASGIDVRALTYAHVPR